MGQAANVTNKDALDTVITNALIVDAVAGVIKADVGIKVSQVQTVHNFLMFPSSPSPPQYLCLMQ